jgi:chemotaxis signal transduction protein
MKCALLCLYDSKRIRSIDLKDISNNNKKSSLETNRQFCTFQIGRHYYGIDILNVKEIIDDIALTQIYHAPEEVLGFINIRGHVYLIIDLRTLLTFDKKEIDESSRVLLFTSDVGESFGVLVDNIGHMVEVDEKRIEYRNQDDMKIDHAARRINALEIGACKLADKLLVILDARKFLEVIKYKE